uniref:alpha-glucosidase n=1 Tax=Corethrella appendiculata TaxID=1370023 RepID=U5EVS3_9DIPT
MKKFIILLVFSCGVIQSVFGIEAVRECRTTYRSSSDKNRKAVYRQQHDWWERGNFYQVYPRSFKDSNGDGIGDLKGITEKLPYLKDIGMIGVWLSPIFKSPMDDFGYDISNFYEIQPEYGSMKDIENMIAECKRLGLKLILDFVPNHTSNQHEFFKKSEQSDPKYNNFYVWHPGKTNPDGGRNLPPSNWISVFRGSAWEWSEQRQEYYLHQFLKEQPDLNYREPQVREEMKSVLRFWLNKGISGFRIDAVPYLVETFNSDGSAPDEPKSGNVPNDPDNPAYLTHTFTMDNDLTYEIISEWKQVLKDFTDAKGGETKVLMTEAYTSLPKIIEFYGEGKNLGAQIPFNFELISYINKDSTGVDFVRRVANWLGAMPDGKVANWVLGNHDNTRIASRLGADRADLYTIALQTLPGIAVTYYGDEIGMNDTYISWKDTIDPAACRANENDYLKYSRDPARTPMQWDSSPTTGFSSTTKTWLPINPNYDTINVQTESQIPRSQLKLFKALTSLRKERALQDGNFELLQNDDNLIVYKREIRGVNPNEFDSVFVILNFHSTPQTVDLTKLYPYLYPLIRVVTSSLSTTYSDGAIINANKIQLPGNAAIVLQQKNPLLFGPSLQGSDF